MADLDGGGRGRFFGMEGWVGGIVLVMLME